MILKFESSNKIELALEKTTPSKITAEELQKELHGIGLTCEETSLTKLEKHITETVNDFPNGNVQGFGIFEYTPPKTEEEIEKGFAVKPIYDAADSSRQVQCNWKPKDTNGYMDDLATIGYREHFDYLRAHFEDFDGTVSRHHFTKKSATADTLRDLFYEIAIDISSTLVQDLDRTELVAMFKNIIASASSDCESYGSSTVNRNIYLVNGYSEMGKNCDEIGIINVEYHLTIPNYQNKKGCKHSDYTLLLTMRTAVYRGKAGIKQLKRDVRHLTAHFKG